MRPAWATCFLCAQATISVAQNSPPPFADVAYRSWVQQDFQKFDPEYRQSRRERSHRLEHLEQQLFEQEQQGRDVACAHQILIELKWLLDSTADFPRIDQRLADLGPALNHPQDEILGRREDPSDGSWGSCYAE